MTEPEQPPAFLGFAGRPVPPPPETYAHDYDPAPGKPDGVKTHFRDIGNTDGDFLADQMTRMHGDLKYRPFDLDAEIDRYDPQQTWSAGIEPEDHTWLYTSALIGRLAHRADLLRELHRNDSEPSPFLDPAQHAPELARLREQTRGLSAPMDLADRFDDVVRKLAEKTGRPLPWRLAEDDRRREWAVRDHAALEELTAAIDHYQLHLALPWLHSDNPAEQSAERDRRTARVAALDTQNHILAEYLTAERVQVVLALLPDSSTRWNLYAVTSLPDPPAPDNLVFRQLRAAADELLTALLHPAARADRATVAPLADRIAELVRYDPALVRELPPLQAGLVRNVHLVQARARGEYDQPAAPAPAPGRDQAARPDEQPRRGAAQQGADPVRRDDAALDAFFGTFPEMLPDGTVRHVSRPLPPDRREAMVESRLAQEFLRGDGAGPVSFVGPHGGSRDAADPTHAPREPVKPARVARPGIAASRHGGPAQPPGTGRAR
ncbi:hypothetical protein CU254_41715 (plasmid) [Amycolatopsis sp. AA4]|uniref:hypothetical protein n=1 Tax=Actinomycetes TaxID=1760 RepID=UPI0001B5516C|nr:MULTISPECIES: hypothetical protein [Actinomycetes]ATY17097.1 hypothetical protein CU254_41715 [Amycolatopsis sp. AA4]